jgi:hypothetical protein
VGLPPVKILSLRLPTATHRALRLHAFERNVPLNQLMSDVLALWCLAATDPGDPNFSLARLGGEFPRLPEEHYTGYRDSLVFVIEEEK